MEYALIYLIVGAIIGLLCWRIKGGGFEFGAFTICVAFWPVVVLALISYMRWFK